MGGDRVLPCLRVERSDPRTLRAARPSETRELAAAPSLTPPCGSPRGLIWRAVLQEERRRAIAMIRRAPGVVLGALATGVEVVA